jgi:hypothetical protein
MSKHPTSTPTVSTIFATYWVDHFFKELREAYLKAKQGRYRHYESDLASLLEKAQRAMPENSKERKAFAKVKVPDSETSRPRVRLANQLNKLSIEIFGKELLPAFDEITINYLVNEECNVCPKFDSAYQSWLIEELRKKNQVSDEHPDNSPLKEYIDHVAAMLHNIFINAPAATAEMFMTHLMEFVKLEQEVKRYEVAMAEFAKNHPIPTHLRFGVNKRTDLKIMRSFGWVTPDQLDDDFDSSDDANESEADPAVIHAEDEKEEIPPYTQEELKDVETIKHLLEFAFNEHIDGIHRVHKLFELLKKLEDYQQYSPSNI